MEILKKIQTILVILSEYKIQITIIFSLIGSLICIGFHSFVSHYSKKDINNNTKDINNASNSKLKK